MNKGAIAISVGVGLAVVFIWVSVFRTGERKPASRALPSTEASDETPVFVPPAPNVEPSVEQELTAEEAAAEPESATSPERTPTDERSHIERRPDRMGPIDKLRAAYESDARDAEAGAVEQRIREVFKEPEIPEGMLRRVSCVKSACKLELRWTASDREGYMIAMMGLVSQVSQELAADPVGPDEGQTVHAIDVYVSRVVPAYELPNE